MTKEVGALVFDKYEIIRRLAVGGMGEIFLARQHGIAGFDRLVILKSLLPEYGESEESVVQFLDEARVAATLNHPNIVSIYEVGQWGGTYYIAMEYIHGANVATLIAEAVKLSLRIPLGVSAKVIHDAAVALDSAHHARDTTGSTLAVIHRDISPQNIMVRTDGVTKVVDFGIAKAANVDSRTRTGTVKGKLGYMSPEQALCVPVDARSDQFSLGIVLWEMCAHRRLFEGPPVEIVHKICDAPIPRLFEVIDGVPAQLDDIVARMLSRDPKDRYPRCLDVAKEITDYLESSTRQVGELEVSSFVQKVCGGRITELIRDLTPSSHTSNPRLATVALNTSSRRRIRVLAMAIASAVTLVAVGGAAYVGLGRGAARRAETTSVTAPAAAPSPAPPPAPPPPAKAVLRVTSTPSGASVRIGERYLGTTPVAVDSLETGVAHVVSLEVPGYDTTTLEVQLSPGQDLTQSVILVQSSRKKGGRGKAAASADRHGAKGASPAAESSPATAAQPGFLSIATQPWTLVYVADQFLGETTLSKKEMRPGDYTLTLVNEEQGISVTRKVTIRAGEVTKLNLKLK